MKNAAVILAAGEGSRFQSNQYKLLSPVNGVPMILRTLSAVINAGFDEVTVVIGAHADEMRNALRNYPVKIVENPFWKNGQSTSLSAGIRSIMNHADRVCLVLGDQPFIQTDTLRILLQTSLENPNDVIVPFYLERRGNPIIVPKKFYELLLQLTSGDSGGKKLLETVGYVSLSVYDPGVIHDIDTVGELKKMQKTNFWKIENNVPVPLYFGTETLADAAKFTPKGAYTSFRTYYQFGVLRLTKHLNRLEETSRLAGYEIHPNKETLKSILASLLDSSEPGEKRMRITIDLEKHIGDIYIAMEPLKTPAEELYQNGIVCLTAEAHRDNPKAKLSNFLEKADSIRSQEDGDYDEILMVSPDGDLLEGLSSNFYGIIGNTIYTADEGVLSGTTRDFILKIAKESGIPVAFCPVKLASIPELDEAFISSTSRSILPIRSINGIVMRKEIPGPVTKQLMDRFSADLEAEIEWLK